MSWVLYWKTQKHNGRITQWDTSAPILLQDTSGGEEVEQETRTACKQLSVHPSRGALPHPRGVRALLPRPQCVLEGPSDEGQGLWHQHHHHVRQISVNNLFAWLSQSQGHLVVGANVWVGGGGFLGCVGLYPCRYVPWSLHQPERDVFNFQTQLDLEWAPKSVPCLSACPHNPHTHELRRCMESVSHPAVPLTSPLTSQPVGCWVINSGVFGECPTLHLVSRSYHHHPHHYRHKPPGPGECR